MSRSFIDINDLNRQEIEYIFKLCADMKHGRSAPKPLDGKTVACVFAKPSLRTRISFEAGIAQLGGQSLYITDGEIQLGKRETIHDVAKVLSRFVSLIMIRTFSHQDVKELARHAEVPVINGLTDDSHPCQILGDYFTILEHRPKQKRYTVAYLGDGNNVANAWLDLAAIIPMDLRIGTSADTPPMANYVERAKSNADSKVSVTSDPQAAVEGADVIYTDVWASMGQKDQTDKKSEQLQKYQVNQSLLAGARPDCLVMHCLPAERGREITAEVIDGPHSVVFDEAENRLHIQKAIMAFLLR